ncbi:hypothetical protein [Ralstonia flaminis]|uniref:DUF2442 domain-containing protein n=1 Tax=Ralstonia flaminis TaxID=3058597 RepID=A0ABN9JFC4_9RALS|nr:hypothetical protein [Ralstonia sp. LMG 18101]CAJ0809969.1 hypothetical protein LMG18101_00733 [Ralstonia sp. LMG 18101]
MPALTNVIPNETWQLALEFEGQEIRLFDASIARAEKDWPEFAYPHKLKNLTFDAQQVSWPGGRVLDAAYLYEKSKPIEGWALQRQVLRLGYKNQAPTSQHSSHHVYGVWLCPFRERAFELGESIGGGHADTGGSSGFSLAELQGSRGWQHHFDLSDCAWAVPLVETASDQAMLLNVLIRAVCRRAGTL